MNRRVTLLSVVIVLFSIFGLGESGNLKEMVLTPKPSDFRVDVWLNKPLGSAYSANEELYVFLKLSESAYVYVYIIDPAGDSHLLFPNEYEKGNYVSAGKVRRIPGLSENYSLDILKGQGRRVVQIIATSERLENFLDLSQLSLSRLKEFLEGSREIRWTSSTAYFYVGSRPQMGVVRFLTHPTGVSVYVDGRYVGTTPVVLELNEGTHMAVFYRDGTAVSRSFEVRPNATTVVEFAFEPEENHGEALIVLKTEPAGAMVFVNGKYYGETPVNLCLKPGKWELTLVKEGYHTIVVWITARSGEQTMLFDLVELD